MESLPREIGLSFPGTPNEGGSRKGNESIDPKDWKYMARFQRNSQFLADMHLKLRSLCLPDIFLFSNVAVFAK